MYDRVAGIRILLSLYTTFDGKYDSVVFLEEPPPPGGIPNLIAFLREFLVTPISPGELETLLPSSLHADTAVELERCVFDELIDFANRSPTDLYDALSESLPLCPPESKERILALISEHQLHEWISVLDRMYKVSHDESEIIPLLCSLRRIDPNGMGDRIARLRQMIGPTWKIAAKWLQDIEKFGSG